MTESMDGALVDADHPWSDAFFARLYDVFPFDADLQLYRDLAREQGGKVLELACGTGRVAIPLALANNGVTGVDASPHMLAVAREKLAREQPSGSLELVQGDMRTILIGRQF